jgi:hypothetical protein
MDLSGVAHIFRHFRSALTAIDKDTLRDTAQFLKYVADVISARTMVDAAKRHRQSDVLCASTYQRINAVKLYIGQDNVIIFVDTRQSGALSIQLLALRPRQHRHNHELNNSRHQL